MTPSTGRQQREFRLPITGNGDFTDANGDIVKFDTYVEHYCFVPTYYLEYKQYKIGVPDIDDIDHAELALCMAIAREKDHK